jgi:hypothetical protein
MPSSLNPPRPDPIGYDSQLGLDRSASPGESKYIQPFGEISKSISAYMQANPDLNPETKGAAYVKIIHDHGFSIGPNNTLGLAQGLPVMDKVITRQKYEAIRNNSNHHQTQTSPAINLLQDASALAAGLGPAIINTGIKAIAGLEGLATAVRPATAAVMQGEPLNNIVNSALQTSAKTIEQRIQTSSLKPAISFSAPTSEAISNVLNVSQNWLRANLGDGATTIAGVGLEAAMDLSMLKAVKVAAPAAGSMATQQALNSARVLDSLEAATHAKWATQTQAWREATSKVWQLELEAGKKAHPLMRHGDQVELPQLLTRANTGLTPDGVKNFPVDATRWFNNIDMLDAIEQTQAKFKAGDFGKGATASEAKYTFDMGKMVGEGYHRKSSIYGQTSSVFVKLNSRGLPITAYPEFPKRIKELK